ncbi:MFS transporter [Hyphobacterium sp. HN65]|uniref:MFS transporter n=1 Tax=Hyphobacterium lacteum TaxID=3116575 RepID=A0ABU7LRX9_9PROT|nr:MFS transporter [Hyphobacterium sp. HN65]MEE2526675.1 MFS transporter [Hyphobacterium sp. HN65]
MTDVAQPERNNRWADSLRIYAKPVMLSMLILGFASGLPLMMVFQKLSFWLRAEGIDRSTIGFIYWVTIAYTIKWMWSPAVDRIPIPFLTNKLGRRRSWMLLAIAGTMVGLLVIGFSRPSEALWVTLAGAMILAYSGATLDISIDAWRIESAENDNQANMAAAYVMGYRGAIMFAGFGLAIAEWTSWQISFSVMSLTMGITAFLILFMKEPPRDPSVLLPDMGIAQRFATAIIDPFKQFIGRLGPWIVPVFLLISIYRMSDFTMGIMASPLYADLGYGGDIIGGIQGGPGILATIAGGFFGGLIAFRFGVLKAMVVGGAITLVTNGAYAWLAQTGVPEDAWRVAIAIVGDNIAGGFVGTVFIAYLSSLTDPANAATQYALLSSLYAFVNKILAGFSGVLADTVGYMNFFLITASYAVPATLLVILIMTFGSPAAKGQVPTGKEAES